MGLFSWLSPKSDSPRYVNRHPIQLRVKLRSPITTPGGSRITVVKADVEVTYQIGPDGNPSILDVKHLRYGGSLAGKIRNASSLQGEGFFMRPLPRRVVRAAARQELKKKRSHFSVVLKEYAKHDKHWEERWDAKRKLAKSLSAGNSAISKSLVAAAAKDARMAFDYEKADGSMSMRTVIVHSVTGNLIRATEICPDGAKQFKAFRIDRMSNVEGI